MRARSLALVFVIALASLAGLAGGCEDCSSEGQPGCCPPACSLCLCCQSPTVLAGGTGMEREPVLASLSGGSQAGGPLSDHPRDVFHVPKAL